MDLENKPYKLITDVIIEVPLERMITKYGVKNITIICLDYIKNETAKGIWVYKVKEFLQTIEQQSKREYPELWI